MCEAARLEKVGTSGMWEDLRDRWGQSEVPEAETVPIVLARNTVTAMPKRRRGVLPYLVLELGRTGFRSVLIGLSFIAALAFDIRLTKGLTVVWTMEIVKS